MEPMDHKAREPMGSESEREAQEGFLSAVGQDDWAAIERWLAAGASVLRKDRFGRLALAEATMRFYQRPQNLKENVEIMRALLALGADPNEAWGPGEEPPLHLAMAGGSVEAARELAAAGARVGARNARGDTALHIAARQAGGRPHGAAYLLSLGLDPKVKNHKGRSALQEALAKNPEVASVIKAFAEAKMKTKAQREARGARRAAPGQSDLFEGERPAPAGRPGGEPKAAAERAGAGAAAKAEEAAPKAKKRHALTEQAPRKPKEPKAAPAGDVGAPMGDKKRPEGP